MKNSPISCNTDGYIFNGDNFKIKDLPLPATTIRKADPVQEKDIEIEKVYCSVFGCGRLLRLVEKLAGDKCLKCQQPRRQYGHY